MTKSINSYPYWLQRFPADRVRRQMACTAAYIVAGCIAGIFLANNIAELSAENSLLILSVVLLLLGGGCASLESVRLHLRSDSGIEWRSDQSGNVTEIVMPPIRVGRDARNYIAVAWLISGIALAAMICIDSSFDNPFQVVLVAVSPLVCIVSGKLLYLIVSNVEQEISMSSSGLRLKTSCARLPRTLASVVIPWESIVDMDCWYKPNNTMTSVPHVKICSYSITYGEPRKKIHLGGVIRHESNDSIVLDLRSLRANINVTFSLIEAYRSAVVDDGCITEGFVQELLRVPPLSVQLRAQAAG